MILIFRFSVGWSLGTVCKQRVRTTSLQYRDTIKRLRTIPWQYRDSIKRVRTIPWQYRDSIKLKARTSEFRAATAPVIGGGWLTKGRGHGAVVKAACLDSRRSRVRTPLWPSSLKETKCFFPAHPKSFNSVGSLRDWEVACSTSDSQGETCVWRAMSPHSSHYPQEVLLTQFSLYVHNGGLKNTII